MQRVTRPALRNDDAVDVGSRLLRAFFVIGADRLVNHNAVGPENGPHQRRHQLFNRGANVVARHLRASGPRDFQILHLAAIIFLRGFPVLGLVVTMRAARGNEPVDVTE